MIKKIKFSTKLLKFSLQIIIPFFIACFLGFVIVNYQSIRNNIIVRERLNAQNIAIQLKNEMNDLSFVSLDILSRNDFINAAKVLYRNSSDQIILKDNFQAIKNTLLSYALSKTSLQVVFFNQEGYFVTNYGYGFDYNYGYKIKDETISNLDWLDKANDLRGGELILPLHKDTFFDNERNVISIARTVRDPGRTIGYLVVQSFAENFKYIWDTLDDDFELLVLDSDNKLIYSSKEIENGERNFYGSLRFDNSHIISKNPYIGERQIISMHTSKETGWKIYVYKPTRLIVRSLIQDLHPIIIAVVLVLIIILFCYTYMSKQFSKPMVELSSQMKNMRLGEVNQKSDIILHNEYEEIEELSKSFYDMQIRMRNMVDKEMEYQKLQYEEHFKTLQSQMNPHFIYNTLSVIGIMGIESGSKAVAEACSSLAKLLKYSISNPKEYATFEEEFDNVQCYLNLLKMRYEHKLNFEIVLDAQLKEQRIPRLTLQPLVENAIKHGFGEGHKQLTVKITAYIENNIWKVIIEDNGIGFSDEALKEINKDIQQGLDFQKFTEHRKDSSRLGIANTFIRLHIFFNGKIKYKFGNREEDGAYIILSSELEEKV